MLARISVLGSGIRCPAARSISMMPDDLLKQLGEAEVRALIAYLQSPRQVELKKATD